MPELPEVETVVRDLRPLVVGRRVRSVALSGRDLRRVWQNDWDAAVVGKTIATLRRRGKWIIGELSSGGRMLIHLGMTGQLTVNRLADPLADHTHLRFGLSGRAGEELRFRDVRRFGSVTYLADEAGLLDFLGRLGPEPFDLDPVAWAAALAKTRRCLKAALLDQRLVAGVGNIYADESLFRVGLHPARLASSLGPDEAEELRVAIGRVLTDAIEKRGSTIRDYIGGSGLRGGYQDEFAVYGRTGQPCRRCGTAVELTRLAGRSSHYCPACQPCGGAGD